MKVERTYTNNQGQFTLSKEFNKVHLLVKFKNDQAKIRALRRARLWQMLLPVEINIGRYSGALNNVTYNILENTDALSDGARLWAAATAHNNVQEYYDYAAQLNIGAPPNKLRVLLTNWRMQGTAAATPMFAKRLIQALPTAFVTTFIAASVNGFAGGITGLVNVLKAEVDVSVGYNTARDGTNVTTNSDRMSENMFHELTHAAHYNKVGNSWWGDFVDAEISQMTAFNEPHPYGDGNSIYSPIIALGESWAYHMGHFMADLKYSTTPNIDLWEQQITYLNNELDDAGTIINTGLSAHVNLLEDFSPLRTANDDFFWIPQGLFYDLMDDRNDNIQTPVRVALDDQVKNYTNHQFFEALDNDIYSLQQYKTRLLNENGNNQQAGVNAIFTFYGY